MRTQCVSVLPVASGAIVKRHVVLGRSTSPTAQPNRVGSSHSTTVAVVCHWP
jgi:hypothetical protein